MEKIEFAGSIERSDAPARMAKGTHLLVDLIGAHGTGDIDLVRQALIDCTEAASATLIDIRLHHFEPGGGITGIAVLAESHISIHSWPEHLFAAIDLFMCGNADPRRALPVLNGSFRPDKMITRECRRGLD
ncbi:adenosylmethionine decarboxylase [Actinophytocola sp.]|uniref:adenosylmethionine decarboxylase n=1 Tax=Actinophytocola sp. TaxID=1872138 RepID=UPI002ED5672A